MTRDARESTRLNASVFASVKGAKKNGCGKIVWRMGGNETSNEILTADWEVELSPPNGVFYLRYKYATPFGTEDVSDRFQILSIHLYRGGFMWYFLCPSKTSTRCKKRMRNLHLSESGHFMCLSCAGFNHNSSRIRDHSIDDLSKKPMEIKKILESSYMSAQKKLKALKALRLLHSRIRRKINVLMAKRKELAKFKQR